MDMIPPRKAALTIFMTISSLVFATFCLAQSDFPYDKDIWPERLRIRGTVMVAQGNGSQDIQDRFFDAAAKTDAAILAIWMEGPDDASKDKLKAHAKTVAASFDEAFSYNEIFIAHDQEQVSARLQRLVQSATGVWIGGEALSNSQLNLLMKLEANFNELIDDRGVVFVGGKSAKAAGKIVVSKTENGIEFVNGLNMISDAVVTGQDDILAGNAAMALHPRLVGISIEEDTAIVLSGRKITVRGAGEVDFRLAGNDWKPVRRLAVNETPRRPNPYTDLIDLSAWRRDAIDRTLPRFPLVEQIEPNVENGTLVIVGGGGMPRGLFDEFIEMAGGEDARLIYVPCTESETVGPSRLVDSWKDKVASASVFHTKDRNKADSDEEFLKPLKEATGIWFGGGRQWNFVDSYYGTEAHKLMLDVLARGGVVGGSSAGASIQGEYLARANPVANFDIMAPGYERGLGFIRGVAIDQHFSQRNRQPNMTSLVDTYPQLLGIGIDETTAIVVQKSEAKVVGRGSVFFYDRNLPVIPGKDDFIKVSNGGRFDLAKRIVIEAEPGDDREEGKVEQD